MQVSYEKGYKSNCRIKFVQKNITTCVEATFLKFILLEFNAVIHRHNYVIPIHVETVSNNIPVNMNTRTCTPWCNMNIYLCCCMRQSYYIFFCTYTLMSCTINHDIFVCTYTLISCMITMTYYFVHIHSYLVQFTG